MLKDILCVVEAGEKTSAALLQGLAMARGYGVYAEFVAAVPGPPPVANIFGTDLVEVLINKAKAEVADTALKVSSQVIELARQQGHDPKVTQESRSLVEIAAAIEVAARTYDVTLIERPDSILDSSSAIFETVLFGSGRPVLLASPSSKPIEHFESVVLAWDGSAPATRAIASALSLFPDLKEIFILTVLGEKDMDELVPGAGIAAHIRRHGIQTTVACVDFDQFDENAGPAIAKHAKAQNADLIIMGGYGHSRLREFILGGVTDYLSKETPVPLLLAH
jgi:nucleotide-binding universal stress UspA family protein